LNLILLYQDQILGKVIDGVPAKYTQCGSSSLRRMHARSKPEDEDEPKEIKYQAGQHFDGSPIIETEKVRCRKFVPFGLTGFHATL
jgi:hypothetical protein